MKNEPAEARYLPQIVEDYKGNPLIEALPPIYSSYEAAKLLTVDPGYNEGEREFDAQYRFRLYRYRDVWYRQDNSDGKSVETVSTENFAYTVQRGTSIFNAVGMGKN